MPLSKCLMSKSSLKWLVCVIAAFLTFVLLEVLFFGAPVIILKNDSGKRMSNILLSGSGFSQTVASLEPHSTTSVVVYPQGESGLKIEFAIEERSHMKDDLAYLERFGGYCVTVRVPADLAITSDIHLFCLKVRRLFPW
jgi:hypothetical protein